MRNTEVCYGYRDADGYKTFYSFVARGVARETEIAAALEALDGGMFFIPSQVGFPDLQDKLQAFDSDQTVEESFSQDGPDHVWHYLDNGSFSIVDDAPTVKMTIQEFLKSLIKMRGKWDVTKAYDAITEAWSTDPRVKVSE